MNSIDDKIADRHGGQRASPIGRLGVELREFFVQEFHRPRPTTFCDGIFPLTAVHEKGYAVVRLYKVVYSIQ